MPARKAKSAKPRNAFRKDKPVGLNVRLEESLRKQIEGAAAARGRSMNLEVVERLERSFAADASMVDTLVYAHGPRLTGLMLIILRAMDWVGGVAAFQKTPTANAAMNWQDDPWAFQQAFQAAFRILTLAAPAGNATPPSDKLEHKHLAVGLSYSLLGALVDPDHPLAAKLGPEIAKLLGPTVLELSMANQIQWERFASKPGSEGGQ